MKRILLPALFAIAALSGTAATYTFSTTGVNDLSHGAAATWGLGGTSYTNLLNSLKVANTTVTSATLHLYDPRDWKDEPADVLYVNILNGLKVPAAVNKVTYNSNPSTNDTSYGLNAFDDSSGWRNDNAHNAGLLFNDAAAGSLLKAPDMAANMPGTWTDLVGPYGSTANNPTSTYDVAITFTAANLSLLQSYLLGDIAENTNGDSWSVGLGFAAECHYYFDQITLEITTTTQTQTQNVPDNGGTLTLVAVAMAALAGFRRRFAK